MNIQEQFGDRRGWQMLHDYVTDIMNERPDDFGKGVDFGEMSARHSPGVTEDTALQETIESAVADGQTATFIIGAIYGCVITRKQSIN